MKKLLLLSVLVLAASCAKKNENNNDDPRATDQGDIVSQTYGVECWSKTVFEETVTGGVIKDEYSNHTKHGSTTTKDKSQPNQSKTQVVGDAESITKRTLPNGKTLSQEVRYSTEKQTTKVSSNLGENRYKDVLKIKYRNVAKAGFDFGLDDQNNVIKIKEKSFTFESVYRYQDRIWEELSAKRDGVDIAPTPGKYQMGERREGDYTITTEKLIEPVADGEPNVMIVSDESECKTKEIHLN